MSRNVPKTDFSLTVKSVAIDVHEATTKQILVLTLNAIEKHDDRIVKTTMLG